MNSSLVTLDWIVIVGYFFVLVGITIWAMRFSQKDTEDYFLAGRNVGWFMIGASIFASNIGAEHVVGLAGTGANSGMPMAHYELHAWIVLLLGWVFLPFYMRSAVFTMPEFLEKRFSPKARWFLSIFSLVSYVMTKVAVNLYAGGIVTSSLLGIDFWTGAIGVLVLTGIYTVLGGMRAVVLTETFQTIILILGAAFVTILGLQKVGGWGTLTELVGATHFNMWRPSSDPNFPWTGLVFGGAIVGTWYWCTDQYIVQRTLSAKNLTEGRRGAIFGAFLKITPVFIFLMPGIICYALAQQGKITLNNPNEAFTVIMQNLLPAGFRGLVAAGLLAALMSSLASIFNSCSTLFTVDVYKKLRPETSEKNLVRVGRIATGVVVVAGLLWVPILTKIGGGVLYQYLQSVQSYIAPPITAVFLLGIFFKRINSKGAMAALWFGVIFAAVRIIAEINKDSLTGFMHSFASYNFMHLSIWLFLCCVLVAVGVSLLTEKPAEESLKGLTFSTLTPEQKLATRNSFNKWDVFFSLAILAIVILIMSYFTGN
ncbi:MAG TPA: sodium:solute symporter [Saprospiraceae bacterium]|nr:sodium:solute symporter [Saprospiraceae bacterium]HNR07519.1 sodium:solute symporter [Saprospiraceae bacterium]HNT21742.1 sodium:solute symporter [Saprospiraceae bacterium]